MTEGQRVVEGMIVKTGLQDATKNVRIYGTISAAASNLLLLLLLPPPPPCPNLRPGSSTSSVPSLVSPPREILFPLSFLLPPAARFPECARPFLLFLLFSSPLPSSRSNPTTRLPAPRFPFPHVFLCRLLYPTFSLDPYSKQPLPTIEHRLAGGSSPHFCGATLMLH